MFYKNIVKPIFFNLNPDYVHEKMTSFGEFFGKFALTRAVVSSIYNYHGKKDLTKIVDRVKYRTPILLSAGFDYNGRLSRILPSLGFSGEEVGSVTARPCLGNKSPHFIRLPKSKSILVRKGLKNDGADKILKRLSRIPKPPDFILGISVARTNDEVSSSLEEGIRDYCYTYKIFNEARVGDFYTLNISCPNAFCGETFADPELLPKLLEKIREIYSSKPLYLKMPINLEFADFKKLLSIADKYKINGLMIGNLNKNYDDLEHKNEAPKNFFGGLSGKPCFEKSNDLIRFTRQEYKNRFSIFGIGGVFTPDDAIAKFQAGADMIQLITGMIFEGPGIVKNICNNL